MNAQITVTLPEDVLERAELLAERTGQPVADLLAETIELALCPLGKCFEDETAIMSWSDDQVIVASESELAADEDRRLSVLLDRQQAGLLTEEERTDLTALMQRYQAGLLRKAQAWREAVRRGLREPPKP